MSVRKITYVVKVDLKRCTKGGTRNYRAWVLEQLHQKYPDAEIEITFWEFAENEVIAERPDEIDSAMQLLSGLLKRYPGNFREEWNHKEFMV